MESLRFSLEQTQTGRYTKLNIEVPDKVQGAFTYNYLTLYQAIKRSQRAVKVETVHGGERYSIDCGVLGKATLRERHEGLKRATQLIIGTQLSAQKHLMLDPTIRLSPSVSPHLGKYPLGAVLKWPGQGRLHVETVRSNCQKVMADARNHLLDPNSTGIPSSNHVGARISFREGVLLGVGSPSEELTPQDFNPEQPRLMIAGETTSREHALILMMGAVAFARTTELATA